MPLRPAKPVPNLEGFDPGERKMERKDEARAAGTQAGRASGGLRVLVLGSAAGGGFPQWNSNDDASRRARAGDPLALPRTQSSIAVSAGGERWVLINASPDLRENSIFGVLDPRFVERRAIALGERFAVADRDGHDTGIAVEPFAVPGKVALYLEDAAAGANFGTRPEDSIGLSITAKGQSCIYIPGCAAFTAD